MTTEQIPIVEMSPARAVGDLLESYASRYDLSALETPSVEVFEDMRTIRDSLVEVQPNSGSFVLREPGHDDTQLDNPDVVRKYLQLTDPETYRLTDTQRDALDWFIDAQDPSEDSAVASLLRSAEEHDSIEELRHALDQYVAAHSGLSKEAALAGFKRQVEGRAQLADHIEANYPPIPATEAEPQEKSGRRFMYRQPKASSRRASAAARQSNGAPLPPSTQGAGSEGSGPIDSEAASRDPETVETRIPGAADDSNDEYADDPHWETDDREPWLAPKFKAAAEKKRTTIGGWLGGKVLLAGHDIHSTFLGEDRNQRGKAALLLGGIATAVADRYLNLGIGEAIADHAQGTVDFLQDVADNITPDTIPAESGGTIPVLPNENLESVPPTPEIGTADGTDATDNETLASGEQRITPKLDRPGEGVTAAIAEELGWDMNDLSAEQSRLLDDYTDQAYAQNEQVLGSRANERSHDFNTEFNLTIPAEQTDASGSTQSETSQPATGPSEVKLVSGGVDTLSEATVMQFRNAGVSLPAGSSLDISLRVADYNGISRNSLNSLDDGTIIRYPSVGIMRQWVLEWEQARQNS